MLQCILQLAGNMMSAKQRGHSKVSTLYECRNHSGHKQITNTWIDKDALVRCTCDPLWVNWDAAAANEHTLHT